MISVEAYSEEQASVDHYYFWTIVVFAIWAIIMTISFMIYNGIQKRKNTPELLRRSLQLNLIPRRHSDFIE